MPPLPWKSSAPIDPAATYRLTVTRLPLRSYRRIPTVLRATLRIVRALPRSDGLVGYSLKADLVRKTFWTVSAWRDEAAIAGFATSDTHRAAMTRLQPHLGNTRVETFSVVGEHLPPRWKHLAARLEVDTPIRRDRLEPAPRSRR